MAIIFDLTDKRSFDCIEVWMEQVREHAGPTVACILIGNKVDSSRRVGKLCMFAAVCLN